MRSQQAPGRAGFLTKWSSRLVPVVTFYRVPGHEDEDERTRSIQPLAGLAVNATSETRIVR